MKDALSPKSMYVCLDHFRQWIVNLFDVDSLIYDDVAGCIYISIK